MVVIRGAQNYISQDEWTEFWKKSAKLDYRPIVDVRSIKPKNEKTSDIRSAILETAKYPVKPMGSVAKFENQTRPLWTQNILGWYSH